MYVNTSDSRKITQTDETHDHTHTHKGKNDKQSLYRPKILLKKYFTIKIGSGYKLEKYPFSITGKLIL